MIAGYKTENQLNKSSATPVTILRLLVLVVLIMPIGLLVDAGNALGGLPNLGRGNINNDVNVDYSTEPVYQRDITNLAPDTPAILPPGTVPPTHSGSPPPLWTPQTVSGLDAYLTVPSILGGESPEPLLFPRDYPIHLISFGQPYASLVIVSSPSLALVTEEMQASLARITNSRQVLFVSLLHQKRSSVSTSVFGQLLLVSVRNVFSVGGSAFVPLEQVSPLGLSDLALGLGSLVGPTTGSYFDSDPNHPADETPTNEVPAVPGARRMNHLDSILLGKRTFQGQGLVEYALIFVLVVIVMLNLALLGRVISRYNDSDRGQSSPLDQETHKPSNHIKKVYISRSNFEQSSESASRLDIENLWNYRDLCIYDQSTQEGDAVQLIGENLRRLRWSKGYSRSECACKLGVDAELLIIVENGFGDLDTAHSLLARARQTLCA